MATETADAGEEVVFKKRGPKKSARKRAATPPSDSDSSEDYSSEDEQGQRQIKRRKKAGGLLTAGSRLDAAGAPSSEASRSLSEGATKFSSDRSSAIQDSNDATRQSNVVQMGAAPKVGPAKAAASNVRMTNFTDFAPDVCKDYKQTGFCGFGDSCKFLHAREDYKAGWQLDNEWDKFAKGKKEIGGKVVSAQNTAELDKEDEEEGLTKEEVELLEKVPFKCIICKEDYKSPIVTKCGHYYCEACALKRFRKSPSCVACGAGTGGVFNQAKGLKKLLEKKEKRENRKKEREEREKIGQDT